MVLLSVARQTACGHDCEKCPGCGVQAGHLEVRAVDRVGVRPGDRVEVRSDNRKLLGMAALVYLLPVAMFLVGYFLGDALARAGGSTSCSSATGRSLPSAPTRAAVSHSMYRMESISWVNCTKNSQTAAHTAKKAKTAVPRAIRFLSFCCIRSFVPPAANFSCPFFCWGTGLPRGWRK